MKSLTLVGIIIVMVCVCSHAQTSSKGDDNKKPSTVGYMGLWDLGVATGYMHGTSHRDYYPGPGYEDVKTNGMFVMAHFQDSALSNYIWATETDKKVKFGITETLDIGCSYLHRNTITNPKEYSSSQSNFGFLFTYEGGGGVVYKLNENMDAGFTYYALVLSSFTPNNRYAKFRYRYRNYMCELSAFGKTAVDLKYLRASKPKNEQKVNRESSLYFGLSIVPKNENKNSDKTPLFLYVSSGFIF